VYALSAAPKLNYNALRLSVQLQKHAYISRLWLTAFVLHADSRSGTYGAGADWNPAKTPEREYLWLSVAEMAIIFPYGNSY
jgi:hypothetical protein